MQPELEPAHQGTLVGVEGLELGNVGTLQVETLELAVQCSRCGDSVPVSVSGAQEQNSSRRLWCTDCGHVLTVTLRPCLLHAANHRLAYVDTDLCAVSDVLPTSTLYSVCAECGEGHVMANPLVSRRRLESTCPDCHARSWVQFDRFEVTHVTPVDVVAPAGAAARPAAAGGKTKRATQAPFVAGQPLPQQGACVHFKKSKRWLRFPCCGMAYPCVTCHSLTDCPAASVDIWCSRMICGGCSREQEFTNSPCKFCGLSLGKDARRAHWEGGGGLRNRAALDKHDSRKIDPRRAPTQKKTTSKKSQRVGATAKKARDKKMQSKAQ